MEGREEVGFYFPDLVQETDIPLLVLFRKEYREYSPSITYTPF